MSLKTIHLTFVLAVVALAAIFGAWKLFLYPQTGDIASLWLGIAALLTGLGLCGYAIRFGWKMDPADTP